MIDAEAVLKSLAARRPIFHSEADFQHEFAWELRGCDPEFSIRLEVPSAIDGVGTTDIVVRHGESVCGIELKYLTKGFRCHEGDEPFNLKAHGAADQRGYDVLKDIQRLERFNKAFGGPSFAIVLTNDPAYWKGGSGRATNAAAFRIGHGRVVEGVLEWAARASDGTKRGRTTPICLRGRYQLSWGDYSFDGQFRHLCVKVS